MKKLIVLVAIALISFSNYAQNSIFDKFEDMDDVTTVVVTQEAFKMLAKFKSGGEEGAEYFDMVKGLNSFRVFTTENSEIAKQMSDVVSNYLKSNKLVELMRVKDKDSNVKIYVKSGKDDDHVSELLMYVGGIEKYNNEIKAESVILSLTGDIDLNKISKLTEAHIPNSGIEVKKQ
jgi:predicted CopG family antitoxin